MNSIQSTHFNNYPTNSNTANMPSDGSSNKNIKIGAYELLGTIGHGNFSVCKLALNKLSNNKVALKCIEKKSVDESHLKRIYKEIDIMKSLDHKHIIKLYQVRKI
jgi:serine/threonine protein kinase